MKKKTTKNQFLLTFCNLQVTLFPLFSAFFCPSCQSFFPDNKRNQACCKMRACELSGHFHTYKEPPVAASLPPKTTVRPSQSPFTGLCRPLVFLRALTEVTLPLFSPSDPHKGNLVRLNLVIFVSLEAFPLPFLILLHKLREHHLPAPLCSGTPLELALTAQIIHKH